MKLANYLFFRSGCEQALEFYAQCGLGRVVAIVRHGDYGPPHDESMRGKVLHSEFAGPGVHFFASDNHDAEPMRGSAHMLILDNRATTDRLFTALADGGEILAHILLCFLHFNSRQSCIISSL